jgi:hypothetical protein
VTSPCYMLGDNSVNKVELSSIKRLTNILKTFIKLPNHARCEIVTAVTTKRHEEKHPRRRHSSNYLIVLATMGPGVTQHVIETHTRRRKSFLDSRMWPVRKPDNFTAFSEPNF